MSKITATFAKDLNPGDRFRVTRRPKSHRTTILIYKDIIWRMVSDQFQKNFQSF